MLTFTMIGLTIISMSRVFQKKRNVKKHSRKESYEISNTQTTVLELSLPLESDTHLVTSSLIRYEKIVWCFWVISANAGLVVTIEYWSLVFRPPTSFMDISVHALNSVFILTELFTGKLPVHILHWIYVMLFSIIYAVFTIIYWAAGGVNYRGDPYIYDILNYENGKPGKIAAVLLLSVFVLSPLLQFIFYGLYRFRFRLQNKMRHSNMNDNVVET